jgi:hypothetical protein
MGRRNWFWIWLAGWLIGFADWLIGFADWLAVFADWLADWPLTADLKFNFGTGLCSLLLLSLLLLSLLLFALLFVSDGNNSSKLGGLLTGSGMHFCYEKLLHLMDKNGFSWTGSCGRPFLLGAFVKNGFGMGWVGLGCIRWGASF